MIAALRRWWWRREARAGYRLGQRHVADFGLYTMSAVARHHGPAKDEFDVGYLIAIGQAEAEAFGTSIYRH